MTKKIVTEKISFVTEGESRGTIYQLFWNLHLGIWKYVVYQSIANIYANPIQPNLQLGSSGGLSKNFHGVGIAVKEFQIPKIDKVFIILKGN